jgi:hypothetical protein
MFGLVFDAVARAIGLGSNPGEDTPILFELMSHASLLCDDG